MSWTIGPVPKIGWANAMVGASKSEAIKSVMPDVGRLAHAAGLLLMIICAVCRPGPAAADYPERPIRLIVPQAPGSATDVLARLLASELGPALAGATIVIDNRPGGALTLGLDLTAKSPPDGYTLCMGPIGALSITRHMVGRLPYDIERDFQPIALISRGHLLLATAPMLPVKTVQELIDYAKQHPGKLTNASSSNGSPGHVGGELFKYMIYRVHCQVSFHWVVAYILRALDRAASGLAVKAASRRLRRWPSASLDCLRPMPRSVGRA